MAFWMAQQVFFRQVKQKPQGILRVFPRIFVKYGEKRHRRDAK